MSVEAPEDWKYCGYIEPNRVEQLMAPRDFLDLSAEILDNCSSTTDVSIQQNEVELRLIESKETKAPHTCRQAVFYLVIPKNLHDYLINSPYGLFGKYNLSPERGRRAMSILINAIKNRQKVAGIVQTACASMLAGFGGVSAERFIELSLDARYAVVWFDEDEFPKEKFKRWQLNAVTPYTFQIRAGQWPPRRVFKAGKRLVVKGAWVTDESKLAVEPSKADLDIQLYHRGFS